MINVIARAWTPTIRNLLRPANLLHAVISCARFAAKSFAGTLYIGADITPVAYGVQSDCISVPLTAIRRLEGTGYCWELLGFPEGIIRFGKSMTGDCALLGKDYIYENGRYLFISNPVIYATISGASAAGSKATYCVTFGNRKRITYEDVFNKYDGALDSLALEGAEAYDMAAPSTNGMCGYAILAACGVRPLRSPSKIKATWREGDKFLSAATNGELIVDIAKNPKIDSISAVQPADSISTALNTNIAVSCTIDGEDVSYYWMPGDAEIFTDNLPVQFKSGSTITAAEFKQASAYPIKVYDTTYGPTDPGSNITLAKRITLSAGVRLIQKLHVDIPGADLAKASYVFIHIGSSSVEPETKLTNDTDKCTLRYASTMYDCIAIPKAYLSDDKLYAITLNGIISSHLFSPGNYILGVGLASGYDDSILGYTSINPVTIKAGTCVALEIQ